MSLPRGWICPGCPLARFLPACPSVCPSVQNGQRIAIGNADDTRWIFGGGCRTGEQQDDEMVWLHTATIAQIAPAVGFGRLPVRYTRTTAEVPSTSR